MPQFFKGSVATRETFESEDAKQRFLGGLTLEPGQWRFVELTRTGRADFKEYCVIYADKEKKLHISREIISVSRDDGLFRLGGATEELPFTNLIEQRILPKEVPPPTSDEIRVGKRYLPMPPDYYTQPTPGLSISYTRQNTTTPPTWDYYFQDLRTHGKIKSVSREIILCDDNTVLVKQSNATEGVIVRIDQLANYLEELNNRATFKDGENYSSITINPSTPPS